MALLLLLTGCAAIPSPDVATQRPSQTCQSWFQALDAQIDAAGVRDAGPMRVAGFPYLRADRFTASLSDRLLPPSGDAARVPAPNAAWIERMRMLDSQARRHELANLPQAARQTLSRRFERTADPASLLQLTQDCSAQRAETELSAPWQIERLAKTLRVPDDYVDAYRVAGLYPLTRVPFLAGIRAFEAETRQRFAASGIPTTGHFRRVLTPEADPARPALTAEDLRTLLRTASDNALGIPLPDAEQSERLFRHFAPSWDIAVQSDDDLPGTLTWDASAQHDSKAAPIVDRHRPVVYRQLAYTRSGESSLLQLVYTLWFGARTPTATPIDLLAGRIDGLVWRVTLSPEGQALVYDSMHPCGCYHMFFPVDGVAVRPMPLDAPGEWVLVPRTAPALARGERMVLRIAAANHYLEGLDVRSPQAPSDGNTHYQWRDYDELRSLPLADAGARSVFDAQGFMPGTDRLESWLFWPMGIARAGSMRQWGRHATAFVGRRHFDDARLMEQRFDLDTTRSGE